MGTGLYLKAKLNFESPAGATAVAAPTSLPLLMQPGAAGSAFHKVPQQSRPLHHGAPNTASLHSALAHTSQCTTVVIGQASSLPDTKLCLYVSAARPATLAACYCSSSNLSCSTTAAASPGVPLQMTTDTATSNAAFVMYTFLCAHLVIFFVAKRYCGDCIALS